MPWSWVGPQSVTDGLTKKATPNLLRLAKHIVNDVGGVGDSPAKPGHCQPCCGATAVHSGGQAAGLLPHTVGTTLDEA